MKKSLIVFLWVLIVPSAGFISQQAVKSQQSDEVQIRKQLVIGPSTQSCLRLNTEMHTACVFRLDTDADGRYILPALNDKIAKFWDARNGDLLRVFRLPIDRGDEGRLDSCALSPDGRFAVVGGLHEGWDNIYQ